jgi:hypothetical protein
MDAAFVARRDWLARRMVSLMRDVRLGKFGEMSGDLSGMSLWLADEAHWHRQR